MPTRLLKNALLAAAVFATPASAQNAAPPAAPAGDAAPASAQNVEPAALALLQSMTRRLAQARTLSFSAQAVFDVPTAEGSPIFLTTAYDVYFARPDRLKVVLRGDGSPFTFVSDGVTMARFEPATRALAMRAAPKGLEALSQIAHEHGIDLPFIDVLLEKPFGDLTRGLTSAFVVGQSRLFGRVLTNIVSLSDGKAHAQIWIGAADNLPRQMWVTEKHGEQAARNAISYSNWRIDARLRGSLFGTGEFRNVSKTQMQPAPTPP